MSLPISTISQLLEVGEDQSVALSSPGGGPLTYHDLRSLVRTVVGKLNGLGVGRNDRVALVLPNGPEMAAAFVAVAAGATAAPLNPGYRAEEFEFYLTDLNAKLLLTQHGHASPATGVAGKLGIAVAEIVPQPGRGAGYFELARESSDTPAFAQADDVALVLHTSGTTSRPKIVPLSQRNVTASARNIRDTLGLSRSDRALNIMPLFHIHGLMAGVLAPLLAGGEICCTPGFNALKFFSWMDESHPTWYTAVPTMHQAIVGRAGHNRAAIQANPLRFLRSSSSPLSPQVIYQLEEAFSAPLIESYGMTEAAHQMASNPLPPAPRKPGTVGVAAGPEICILDPDGNVLPAGSAGEIAIRGDNVTAGYENNPAANQDAFANGWFRTGDQGLIDQDGYLFITGRLKEIINRGGEKISPREVDEVLMDHPAVQQAVAFAIRHDKLGEDLAAAVVLREGKSVTERELRDFVASRLVDFKVPRKVLLLEEIPKGATGKLQRIGLAKVLGLE